MKIGVIKGEEKITNKLQKELGNGFTKSWKRIGKGIYKKIIELSFILSWEECKD